MSKVIWHKSASKDVRPFFGAATLEDSVSKSEIRLYEDGEFIADEAFVIEPQDAAKLCVVVRPNLSPAALSSEAIKKGDLVLAVTAVQRFLKKTCVVAQLPVSAAMPSEIPIGDEVIAQLGGGANITIEVALCLSKPRPKQPGSPFLLGHWLSKKSFFLKAPKLSEEFDITPMDDEQWKQLGWPAKTFYAVQYLGGFNEPAAKDKKTAIVRIHTDIHKKLTLESSQRLAKPMMAALAAEISCQLIAGSLPDWETADEVVPLSPLSAFLKRVDRVQPTSFEDLKAMAKEPGMPKLKALLHADQQTVRFVSEG